MTRVLLVATYELGQQPGNLARPAALLAAAGHEVRVLDASIDPWDSELAVWAEAVAFSVPMHTATRLARDLLATIDVPTCCYGLYAHLCADVADRTISGEYERALVEWVDEPTRLLTHLSTVELDRAIPSSAALPVSTVLPVSAVLPLGAPPSLRALLPPLDRYAHLIEGEGDGDTVRLAASVETTRGCAHRCRHCPVPVVYDGRVRVQDEEAVLGDIAQLVAAGATHLTFGDPDFLNAPAHAMRIVRAVHTAHPQVTFDATVKVEHVLRHRALWPELAASGCLFVVSAFESVDDATLERLDKGHTTKDAAAAVDVLRAHGIDVRPSFLPFTPWTTRDHILTLLDFVHDHDLVASVDPVQYSIRLLLPPGSLLLGHPDMTPYLGEWDAGLLTYRWRSPDPAMDELQIRLARAVEELLDRDLPITEIYAQVREHVGAPAVDLTACTTGRPHLSESWFCCAEPTRLQRNSLATKG
ncbi:MAG: CUAEP/CCAEP-tail radical SAM (seleno)protein [Acidimicrobiia bacterium]